MIESLFEEVTTLPKEEVGIEREETKQTVQIESEYPFLASLPIVRAIVNRKIVSSLQNDASDLVQVVTLKLLKWREKYQEKSNKMSPDDWDSFAARTTYNEINRYFSNQKINLHLPIEKATSVAKEKSAEGNTEIEFISLTNSVWQKICCLSLRQRRAMLLNSQELIVYLLKGGVDEEEMLINLELTKNEWGKVKNSLPMTDAQIAKLILKDSNNKNVESLTRSIKKGRHEARKKMRRLMDK